MLWNQYSVLEHRPRSYILDRGASPMCHSQPEGSLRTKMTYLQIRWMLLWPGQCAGTLGVMFIDFCSWRDRLFAPNNKLNSINWKWIPCNLFTWFRCYITTAIWRTAAPILKQMWRRKASKGVSIQIISMSRTFPNPALCSYSWPEPVLSK